MMKTNKIIIIDLPGSTSFQSFKNLGYNVFEPYQKKQKSDFRIRSLLHLFRLENFALFDRIFDINTQLEQIKNPQLIIIIGSLIYEPFLRKLKSQFPEIPIIYSYSNIVRNLASINALALKKYGIEGFSWDIDDCSKYGLTYQRPSIESNIFYNYNFNQILYDVCFIGADKGRYKMVKKIENVLSDAGLSTYIHITPNYSFLRKLHKDYKNKISYNQYLDITAASRCIIDLVQKGQAGTTMRTMEAIFSRKKLISNNERLKGYDFYNPNNIFIVTEDNLKDIPYFLKLPYVPLKDELLKKYTLKNNIEEVIQSIIY